MKEKRKSFREFSPGKEKVKALASQVAAKEAKDIRRAHIVVAAAPRVPVGVGPGIQANPGIQDDLKSQSEAIPSVEDLGVGGITVL